MSKVIFDNAYDICRSMRATCEAHPALAASVPCAIAAYNATDPMLPEAERWDRAGNMVSAPPEPIDGESMRRGAIPHPSGSV